MRFLKFFLAAFVVIVALLFTVPYLFHEKITILVKEEINKNLNATIDFSSSQLSLLSSFPDFNLRLGDFSIKGKDVFENDTLLYATQFNLSLDFLSVFKGSPYSIKKIRLNEPFLNLLINEEGHYNWDIIPESSTEIEDDTADTENFTLNFQSITIKNGTAVYTDRELVYFLSLDELNGLIRGDVQADKANLLAKLTSSSVSTAYESYTLLNAVQAVAELIIDADFENDIYKIKTNSLKLNEMDLDFTGDFSFPDDNIGMNFTVEAPKSNFKQFLSLLPAAYLKDYKEMQASGDYTLKMIMAGEYGEDSFPAFDILLAVDNGQIGYQNVKERLENIEFKLAVVNQNGNLDQTLIDIHPLRFHLNDVAFETALHIRNPISDPQFSASMKGGLFLEQLASFIPDKALKDLGGELDLNLALKSRMSDIEQGRYESIEAAGIADIRDFKSYYSPLNTELELKKAVLEFSPDFVSAAVEDFGFGSTNFSFSGILHDYLGYFLKDGILHGDLQLSSANIDLQEVLQYASANPASAMLHDTSTTILPEFPERIDLNFTAEIDNLTYENYHLKDITAKLHYVDKVLSFAPMKANLLGGFVQLSGLFDAVSPESPLINLDFSISGFDIPLAYETIGLFRAAAPVAAHTSGSFSTNFSLKGRLDEQLNPVFESLQGLGGLSSSQIRVDGIQSMDMIGSLLGNDELKRIVTDGLNLQFEIINGRLYQNPFDLTYANSDVRIGGSIGFDQSLDYDLLFQLPYDMLGADIKNGILKIVDEAKAKGIPLNVGKTVQIKAGIKGTVTAPKVHIDYEDFASNLKDDLERLAREELEKQKEEIRKRLSEEAAKIMEEAEQQARKIMEAVDAKAAAIRQETAKAASKLREETDKQAQKLIDEAKAKGPIAERLAKEAAKKLQNKAEATIADLEFQADKRIQKLQEEAQNSANVVIKNAERRVEAL